MRLSCLINNYNYGRYLGEAVRSALAQTTPFDEVIVVDDGSDDDSARILAGLERSHPRVRAILKPNGGQLSAFDTGFANCTGDIVFFLDSDDAYLPGYVERMLPVFLSRPDVGYAYCGRRFFGRLEREDRPFPQEMDLGFSAAAAAMGRFWLGASTSCVSMRRSTLEQVLPAPDLESLWTINADLCLAYGASLVGARKYCVPEPLVGYRVHEHNRYFGKREDATSKYQRRLRSNSLSDYYVRRLGYDRAGLARLLDCEFATIPRPTRMLLKHYSRCVLESKGPFWRQLWQLKRMTSHYLATRFAPAAKSTATQKAPAPAPAPVALHAA